MSEREQERKKEKVNEAERKIKTLRDKKKERDIERTSKEESKRE